MGLKSVEMLREKTMELLANLEPDTVEPGMTEWEGVRVYTLYSQPPVGVVRFRMKQGKMFPKHAHRMCETFHVFTGTLSITLDDKTVRVMKAPSTTTLGERVAHTITALEDVEAVCVTMPRDKAYPR